MTDWVRRLLWVATCWVSGHRSVKVTYRGESWLKCARCGRQLS